MNDSNAQQHIVLGQASNTQTKLIIVLLRQPLMAWSLIAWYLMAWSLMAWSLMAWSLMAWY